MTLDYIKNKFCLEISDKAKMPVEIPNFGRNELASLFGELGFKIGVEVGVREGVYAEVLCKANPNGIVYGVDPWLEHLGYRDEVPQKQFDTWHRRANRRTSTYANHVVICKTSMDAVSDFAPSSLDWVYIDANHMLEYVIEDLVEWSARVRSGGIVSGHDYFIPRAVDTHNHVHQAVRFYTDTYRIRPWFVLGRYKSDPDEIRDRPRSWMWVK